MQIIYTESGYTLSATTEGPWLRLEAETSIGKKLWGTCQSRITEIPPAVRRQLPVDWRGFWLGYPIREGARGAVEALMRERDVASAARFDAEQVALEAACPGIKELQAVYADHERYRDDFRRMMED